MNLLQLKSSKTSNVYLEIQCNDKISTLKCVCLGFHCMLQRGTINQSVLESSIYHYTDTSKHSIRIFDVSIMHR